METWKHEDEDEDEDEKGGWVRGGKGEMNSAERGK